MSNLATVNSVVLDALLVHDAPGSGVEILHPDAIVDAYNNIVYEAGYGMRINTTQTGTSRIRLLNNTVFGCNAAGPSGIRSTAASNVAVTLRNDMIVCVNTTRPWRHKHGEVSALQVDRVARLLEGAESAQLRIVVVHQPVAVTRTEDMSNRLRGHEAALDRWAAAGVDLVMGGHIHLPYVMPLQGLARPLWAVQAGTAVSSRVRGEGVPNSVNCCAGARIRRQGAAGSSSGTTRPMSASSFAQG